MLAPNYAPVPLVHATHAACEYLLLTCSQDTVELLATGLTVQALLDHGALPSVRDEALCALAQLSSSQEPEAAMATSAALAGTRLLDDKALNVRPEERIMAQRLCLLRSQEIYSLGSRQVGPRCRAVALHAWVWGGG